MEENNNITSPSLSGNNDSRLMPIENLIHIVRGEQVMLDSDLAKLYGVETRVLNQAVKRNIERFPLDFMFQLNKDEAENLRVQIATTSSRSQNVILKDNLGDLKSQNLTSNPRSQIATLKQGHNIKYQPYAFTENGVAMLNCRYCICYRRIHQRPREKNCCLQPNAPVSRRYSIKNQMIVRHYAWITYNKQ